jgi:hypothetical protein
MKTKISKRRRTNTKGSLVRIVEGVFFLPILFFFIFVPVFPPLPSVTLSSSVALGILCTVTKPPVRPSRLYVSILFSTFCLPCFVPPISLVSTLVTVLECGTFQLGFIFLASLRNISLFPKLSGRPSRSSLPGPCSSPSVRPVGQDRTWLHQSISPSTTTNEFPVTKNPFQIFTP